MSDRLITGTVLYQEPLRARPLTGWLVAATVLYAAAVLVRAPALPRLPPGAVALVIRA